MLLGSQDVTASRMLVSKGEREGLNQPREGEKS